MNDTIDLKAAAAIAELGHNGGPEIDDRTPYERIRDEIEDIFMECRNWADGEPIADQATHDEIERLYDMLHEAGKRADDERKAEAKPHDDAKAEIQERYNKLIGNTKSVKGKVVLGKEALGTLLVPWRTKVAEEKEAAAKAAREEADRIAAEAQAAMRASSGNLEEREKAESLLQEAKQVERFAKRQDKAATTGTGLRSYWFAELADAGAALDWAYGRDPARFNELALSMANEAVRAGARSVPGFVVKEDRRAA